MGMTELADLETVTKTINAKLCTLAFASPDTAQQHRFWVAIITV